MLSFSPLTHLQESALLKRNEEKLQLLERLPVSRRKSLKAFLATLRFRIIWLALTFTQQLGQQRRSKRQQQRLRRAQNQPRLLALHW
jgi:hypothetical protein